MADHAMAWMQRVIRFGAGLVLAGLTLLAGCDNSPHGPGSAASNTLYTAFTERSPRHLDPVASYWNQDTPYTYGIYEPPYTYHYLKRPFTLIPKVATEVAPPVYLDKNGRRLAADAPGEQVAESVYEVRIRPGIRYQPHPAFAQDAQGRYLYHQLSAAQVGERTSPWQFEVTGTRELVAEDFVYGLKRHATTRVTTPIFGIFAEYIVGLKEYGALVKQEDAKLRAGLDPAALDKPFLDFRRWPLAGVSAPEKHLLRLRIRGKYPQWKYWMAMPFAAPMPWEADAFYAQPGMARNGLSLDRWPVGTGPFMMAEFEQDRRHVLVRNPNYRGDPYPCEGMPGDRERGLLDDCGKPTPFVDRIVFQMEREQVPLKAKFRQGFLDVPEIERTDRGADYLIDMEDSPEARAEYTERGYQLPRAGDLSIWFMGFNMLDPVVGRGDTPEQQARNRRLRQAISIALDWADYSNIFPNKGGVEAMGPLPAGIFGSRQGALDGVNPVTHRVVDGKIVRRPIEDARKLMVEAGYPDGRDARTGRPLVINYDFYRTLTPEFKAEIDWMSRQFGQLGIQLEVRATDNNQFQDKVRKGRHQLFFSGWLADYPDAENFLFLLYGPNGKTRSEGENTANYDNPAFDRLFQQLKDLDDGPPKQALIDRMVALLQDDAPWIWGYIPDATGAFQPWVRNAVVPVLIKDHLRFYRVDTALRTRLQRAWNRPVGWPLMLAGVALLALVWFGWRSWRARERATAR
ncbi:extracellular solute-binding protein family 5 [Leptothrix cholodnii SP-6]|uniref:Extracellular solute-binding protein family 5 n=2 Tax=Leptothrix cholodnii TaxID=34029 RepID=B1Y201_LEPCP|nr:extracellular solute-binding protein family 5 [Leptothrix cholodnii SP-6]